MSTWPRPKPGRPGLPTECRGCGHRAARSELPGAGRLGWEVLGCPRGARLSSTQRKQAGESAHSPRCEQRPAGADPDACTPNAPQAMGVLGACLLFTVNRPNQDRLLRTVSTAPSSPEPAPPGATASRGGPAPPPAGCWQPAHLPALGIFLEVERIVQRETGLVG